jgi:hypothetical protein
MMGTQTPTGYSASVRLWLLCNGRKIPLSHSSSTFVIAAEPVNLPAGDAKIVFTVDGTPYERAVTLPEGMSRDVREAMVISRDQHAPF